MSSSGRTRPTGSRAGRRPEISGRWGPSSSWRLGASQPGRQLTFHEGGLEANQDWKRIEVVFNSLDQKEANLYVGLWGEGPGTLWVDDLSLEELPLVNVLRRKGCPLTVKSAERPDDLRGGPRLRARRRPAARQRALARRVRVRPSPGRGSGSSRGSRIKAGDRLLVSWYHPVITLARRSCAA